MALLFITVFINSDYTYCFNLTHTIAWFDLCAFIDQRSHLSINQLYYYTTDTHRIAQITNEVEWNTLKRHCNTDHITLMTDPTITNVGSVYAVTPSNQAPTSFTSQFKQFGKLMEDYNQVIQQDECMQRLMQQTARDFTLQHIAIDWADLETRLKTRRHELDSKRSSWHPSSHLPSRRVTNMADSPSSHKIPLRSGTIWGAYPAYSALHPPPPTRSSLYNLPIPDSPPHISPTSLSPPPPPGILSTSTSKTVKDEEQDLFKSIYLTSLSSTLSSCDLDPRHQGTPL
ncbi:hypothetical protein BC941DRAFT_408279, partial [Chlamydoabsidia padenii]